MFVTESLYQAGSTNRSHALLSYLHGEQSCEVDLRDSLGSLPAPLPHTSSPVLGQLGLFTGFHQMPKPHSSLLPVIQHRGFWWVGGWGANSQMSIFLLAYLHMTAREVKKTKTEICDITTWAVPPLFRQCQFFDTVWKLRQFLENS